MARVLAFTYGAIAYVVFLATFLYAIAFVGDLPVPRTVDRGGPQAPPAQALLVDALLLTAFAVQHSVMARQGFKRWWTQIVPRPVERSTYVLVSSLLLALLFWQWRPLTGTAWEVGGIATTVLTGLFWLGWLIVLLSTFMISHFELFGLRQVWLELRRRGDQPLPFSERLLYRFVRHPIMLGFLVAFWATPRMSWGHLLFAVATTGYVLVALQLEERDLVRFHGRAYEDYRRRVPMLLPLGRRAAGG